MSEPSITLERRSVGETHGKWALDMTFATGASAPSTAAFRLVDSKTRRVVVDWGAATLPTTARVEYQPATADVAVAGIYTGTFRVTHVDGTFTYSPTLRIEIEAVP